MKAISRRNFMSKGTLGVLALRVMALGGTASASLLMLGCNVWNDIAAYAQLGLNAFGLILTVLSQNGIISVGTNAAVDALIAIINKGFADIGVAVNEYESQPNATAAQKAAAVIQALSDNIAKFLQDLTIPNAHLVALVVGMANVILSTLAGFLQKINQPVPASLHAYKVSGSMQTVAPVFRKSGQFKKDWNQVVSSYSHPELELQ